MYTCPTCNKNIETEDMMIYFNHRKLCEKEYYKSHSVNIEKIDKKKITKFYVAYRYRGPATIDYITATCSTYESALSTATKLLCDDDDTKIWFKYKENWYCVFQRDSKTGQLIVSCNEINYFKRYLSEFC